MARLWSSGFELNTNTANVEFTQGVLTLQTTTVRSGTYAGQVTGMSSETRMFNTYQFKASADNGPFFFRFYFRVGTAPSAANTIFRIHNDIFDSANGVVFIKLGSNRTLTLFDEDGQIGSASSALTLDTWYRVEVQVNATGAGSTDIVRATLDGTEFAGSATRNLSAGFRNAFYGGNLHGEAQTQGVWYFDDIAINDGTGSFQNSYPGEGEIIHLRPNAAGDNAAWFSATGAANYLNVDEVTPDDLTTRNTSSTLDQIDDHNLDATPAALESTDTINCVQVGVRFHSEGGALTPQFVLRIKASSGGTVEESGNFDTESTTWLTNAAAAPRNYPLTLYDLPGASSTAWTKSDLDSAQIGYKVSVDDFNSVAISTLWLLVDHKPGEAGTTSTSSTTSTSTTSTSSSTSTTSTSSSTSTTTSTTTTSTSSSTSTSTTSTSSSTSISTTSTSSSTSTTSTSSSTSSSTSTTISITTSTSTTSTSSSTSSSTTSTSSSTSTTSTSSSTSTSTTSTSSSTSTTSTSSSSSTSTTSTSSSTSTSTSTSTTSTSSSTSQTTSTSTTSTSSSTSTSTTSTSSSTSTTSTSSSTSTSTTSTSSSTSQTTSTSTTISITTSTSTTSTSSSTSTTSTSSSTSTSTTSTSSSTSSSTSTTSTSSSTSISTTTTLDNAGGLAFGEQNPTMGESPVSWQTWDDGAGVVPTIVGDSNWGKLQISINEEGRSKVYGFTDSSLRQITITENRYGTGQGTATMQYRISATVFFQDDVSPSWQNYVSTFTDTFKYIQIRVNKTV